MNPYALALVFSFLILLLIFIRLRNSRMNERYATWWIVIAVVLIICSVFPGSISWAARVAKITVPLNLVFFLAGVVVLLLSLQFSVDLSHASERRRRLAEEIALLRSRVDQLEAGACTTPPGGDGVRDQAPDTGDPAVRDPRTDTDVPGAQPGED